ncbi:hypothetical protein DRW41_10360 [Neobacillus piezotolerans]|uniref:Dynamin N-terminal domain-containing protein n=1 Tax=Neobacillus piezotolerans TaxID=2259171 RepID=A0A3D8GS88_9BACI|nr:dynamin family protein [Neobacillus piezotolerans]RDU37079.1 hypothetical protein DRW41_10360 [Neobacillus piezotolerans]
MSFSLDVYTANKRRLVDQLYRLQVILHDIGNQNDLKKVEDLRNQIKEDQFQIVVVGEFSRGKSTFINALLGKKLLPSSARPTTTLLNVITHSTDPFIKLHYRNKKQEYVTEERFNSLVAPKEPFAGDTEGEALYEKQVEIIRSIEYAEIGHPLNFCKDGVKVIDTPGTNDLDPAREQLTNSIIPQSDAAILILSAIKILSESELSFLRDRILGSDIQKIFIVVNQMDLLESPEEVEKIRMFAYDNLQGILHEPKIFMVAAKDALNARRKAAGEEMVTKRGKPIPVKPIEESGFLELESALADFLQFERGAVKLQKPIQRTDKLISDVLEKQIHFQYNTLNQQRDGLEEKVSSFKPRVQMVRKTGKESLKKIVMQLKMEETQITKWYEAESRNITQKGLETFESNRMKHISDIGRIVETAIAPLERRLHEEKKTRMTKTSKKVIQDMSKQLNNEWFKLEGDLLSISSKSGQDDWEGTGLQLEPEWEYSLFDSIVDELDAAWENSNSFIGKLAIGTGFLIAGAVNVASILIGGFVSWLTGEEDEKTKFRRKLNSQLDNSEKRRNLQFKNEWDGMVNAIQTQYEQIINDKVQELEGQLNQLLENTLLEEKEIEIKMEVLHRREAALQQIKDELSDLYQELTNPPREKAGIHS